MKSLSTREIAKPSHGTTSVEVKLKNFASHLSCLESNSHREEITKLMFLVLALRPHLPIG